MCVLWGKKVYDAAYVQRLYAGVRRNFSLGTDRWDFHIVTDWDPTELGIDAIVESHTDEDTESDILVHALSTE